MPFRSQAQRRLFYARPELRKHIEKWEAETPKGKKLPEHVGKKQSRKRQSKRAALLARMRSRKE
jgi:hypothetical protein